MSRENDGINETIFGWFKRVYPEELWAIKEMPPTVTFKDMEKSMTAGQGMGEAEHHSDTATGELMLDRLAELLDKDVDELIDWCNANFRERVRCEYKAKHPKAKKPDIKKLRDLAVAAEVAVRDLASAFVERRRLPCARRRAGKGWDRRIQKHLPRGDVPAFRCRRRFGRGRLPPVALAGRRRPLPPPHLAHAKPRERNGKMVKATVWFSASGYRSETRSFKSKEEAVESVKRDAAEIADEHNGKAMDYGNGEWVMTSRGGEEIARWEIR